MKLVFFGGVHGVGKTTLLERMLAVSARRPHVVDPGELFWEHVYRKKDKTPDDVEVLAVKLIEEECACSSMVVCNWHYAVWTPEGYIPEIAFHRLAAMIERIRPECVHLVLVSASPESIFSRRVKDRSIKKRKIDRACVEEEIAQTEMLFRLHHDVIAPCARTVVTVFDNTNPIDSSAIELLVKKLYETT